jgi:hypothetical protein
MTATTTNLDTQHGQRTVQLIRHLALAIGSFAAAVGSRWSAFVEAGQLGPDAEQSTGRHTGARI